MSVVCQPAFVQPSNLVSQEEVLDHVRTRHAGHPRLEQILRLMRNTSVEKRALALPFDQVVRPRTFGERNADYLRIGTELGTEAALRALAAADTAPSEVDHVIVVSCTGFVMPGLDTYLVAELGLRRDVSRIPVAQLGCAGGAYALARARQHIEGHPEAVVLVVAVELCSLSYQPHDEDIASFVSTALFGDAAAATVVRGDRPGLRLDHVFDDLSPGTEKHISYRVDELGFHFHTDPRISRVVAEVMPLVARWLEAAERQAGWRPDFVISHTGGPRIMYEVSKGLGIPQDKFDLSAHSLTQRGNTASSVVLDVLAQTFDRPPAHGDRGLVIAFGPGVTSSAITTTWLRH